MIITGIRAAQPPTPGSPSDWRTQLGQIVVEVQTDTGLCGYGVGGGGASAVHVIETVFRDLLMGRDAENVEALHQEVCRHTAFYGRKGLVVMAISGLDLALWDLRGKSRDQSIAELLADEFDIRRPLPTYMTVFDDQAAQTAMQSGHRAIKLHVERFGDQPDATAIAQLVEQTRERLGEDAEIMLDAFARWDVETSLRVAELIAPFRVTWLEEPLPPDDLPGYARLMKASPVPIAGGEHEYLAEGFQQLIDENLHAVLQPDVNWCGGLTTLIEIYKMARQADVRVCPHRGCEPYALPAIAALDPRPLAESPRQWFTCLAGAPVAAAGVIHASSAPGFGVSVPPDLFERT
jgi:L-rhamnonate dehydratase